MNLSRAAVAMAAFATLAIACFETVPPRCPPGAEVVGAAPPAGSELYCVARDANGNLVKHGLLERWWPTGTKRLEAKIDHGVVVNAIGWCVNGTKALDMTQLLVQQWYCDGTKEAETPTKGGKNHGAVRVYRGDGSLAAEIGFNNGVQDGPTRLLYPSGAVKQEMLFVAGKPKDGVASMFGPDGKTVIGAETVVAGQVTKSSGAATDPPPELELVQNVLADLQAFVD